MSTQLRRASHAAPPPSLAGLPLPTEAPDFGRPPIEVEVSRHTTNGVSRGQERPSELSTRIAAVEDPPVASASEPLPQAPPRVVDALPPVAAGEEPPPARPRPPASAPETPATAPSARSRRTRFLTFTRPCVPSAALPSAPSCEDCAAAAGVVSTGASIRAPASAACTPHVRAACGADGRGAISAPAVEVSSGAAPFVWSDGGRCSGGGARRCELTPLTATAGPPSAEGPSVAVVQ